MAQKPKRPACRPGAEVHETCGVYVPHTKHTTGLV